MAFVWIELGPELAVTSLPPRGQSVLAAVLVSTVGQFDAKPGLADVPE